MQRMSLRDVVKNNYQINEKHIESFKRLLLQGMRSPKRIAIINNLTPRDIYSLANEEFAEHIIFTRIKVASCYYRETADYKKEISQIRDTIVKKRKVLLLVCKQ